MQGSSIFVGFYFLFVISAGGTSAFGASPDHILLSTAALAREIRTLQGPKDDRSFTPRAYRLLLSKMRTDISRFVIQQIEAYPSISECDLQRQLTLAFAAKGDACGGSQQHALGSPHVFAQSCGPKSITVNNLQPGPIDTDLNPASGDWAVSRKAATALDRYGRVDEIAAMVAFVAGPESSYITEANLTVDGGMNA
jgi:Enoyl-(Acyl carrier protein) reductase